MAGLCKPRPTLEERKAAREKARQERKAGRKIKRRSAPGAKGAMGDEGVAKLGDDGPKKKGKSNNKKGCGSRGVRGKTGKPPTKRK